MAVQGILQAMCTHQARVPLHLILSALQGAIPGPAQHLYLSSVCPLLLCKPWGGRQG